MSIAAPERIWATEDAANFGQDRFHTTRQMSGLTEYIRADLVQEIVAEAVKAEREACAQVADDLALDRWREYKDRMSIYCASTHHEGMSDGASDVATAIRARGEGQPQEKGE